MNTRKVITPPAVSATTTRVDDEKFVSRNEVWNVVADAEGDIFRVYDLALILHDHLTRREHMSKEMQGALSHLTGELCDTGGKLRGHCRGLYRLSGVEGGENEEAGQ